MPRVDFSKAPYSSSRMCLCTRPRLGTTYNQTTPGGLEDIRGLRRHVSLLVSALLGYQLAGKFGICTTRRVIVVTPCYVGRRRTSITSEPLRYLKVEPLNSQIADFLNYNEPLVLDRYHPTKIAILKGASNSSTKSVI